MKKALLLAAVVPTLAACITMSVIGPKKPLIPEGELVTVTLASGVLMEGELLAVDDSSLVLEEQNGTLATVGLPLVSRVLVKRYEITIEEQLKEKLSLYSRYPQGLTAQQWQQLLGQAGQKGLVEVTP